MRLCDKSLLTCPQKSAERQWQGSSQIIACLSSSHTHHKSWQPIHSPCPQFQRSTGTQIKYSGRENLPRPLPGLSQESLNPRVQAWSPSRWVNTTATLGLRGVTDNWYRTHYGMHRTSCGMLRGGIKDKESEGIYVIWEVTSVAK